MIRTTAAQVCLLAMAMAAAAWSACGAMAGPVRNCGRPALTLTSLSWAAAQDHIARRKGQVVLVDVWTTTCPVCREHFPEFARLQRRLAGRGLVCLSLNCDYDGIPEKPPRHYAPRVREFLAEQDARFTNILLTDPLLDVLDAAGIGSTPTYLLYGRDGRLLRRFDGSAEEFTFAEVVQAVESAVSTACGNATHGDGN
jgi:thiol-disulfide isomerase/thioredoxin